MSASEWEQVGIVEVLKARVYPIDPLSEHPLRTEVWVDPGVFPVYRKADAIRWMLSGRISERNEKIGDGLYALHSSDNPVGQEVTFPSRVYGIDEFAKFMEERLCRPGPERRLVFDLNPTGVTP